MDSRATDLEISPAQNMRKNHEIVVAPQASERGSAQRERERNKREREDESSSNRLLRTLRSGNIRPSIPGPDMRGQTRSGVFFKTIKLAEKKEIYFLIFLNLGYLHLHDMSTFLPVQIWGSFKLKIINWKVFFFLVPNTFFWLPFSWM
jgi:hypothetical protein